MERFYCYLAGFAIALALVAVFCIVKNVVEEYLESLKREMRDIAREEVLKEANYIKAFLTLEKNRNKSKLAEKEGGHEGSVDHH